MLITSAILLSLLPSIFAAESTPKPTQKPCTIQSPTTGSYYDLNSIKIKAPTKSSSKDARVESYHSRGYDYNANFTINFCAPVIEDLGKVDGIPESKVANISAFYKKDGKTYSIGQLNTEPFFRGRKLILNYTDGSPCPETPVSSLAARELIEDDPKKPVDDDKSKDKNKTTPQIRRKTTILSFLCDRDPQYTDHPQISFIATPDSCSYYFEVRSRAACGGAPASSPSSLGPGGVFGVIFAIAVCVYLVGGCAYQRTVMHQRGWRQCPNWSVWKALFDFLGDTFIIVGSSLSRVLHIPSFNRAFNAGGYHRVGDNESSSLGRNGGIGRGARGPRTAEDENRLIDQLDEEWDD